MTEYGNDYVLHHPLIVKATESTESTELTGSFVKSEIKRLSAEIKRLTEELNVYENRLIFGSRGPDGEYGKNIAEVNQYGNVKLTELAVGFQFGTDQAKNFAAWIQAASK